MSHHSHRYRRCRFARLAANLNMSDLQPSNVLFGIQNDQIIKELIAYEAEHPTPFESRGDRRIYSRYNLGAFGGSIGYPKIADFGIAVDASEKLHNHLIQPDRLRAPEVILRAGWSYSADIWNLGVMVSLLFASGLHRMTNCCCSDLGCYGGPSAFRCRRP